MGRCAHQSSPLDHGGDPRLPSREHFNPAGRSEHNIASADAVEPDLAGRSGNKGLADQALIVMRPIGERRVLLDVVAHPGGELRSGQVHIARLPEGGDGVRSSSLPATRLLGDNARDDAAQGVDHRGSVGLVLHQL